MPDRDSVPQVTDSTQPEECWTTIDGLRIRYLRAGSGPALILLHGLLGYSFSWRFNIADFARNRSVYAVDMPGAGFSQRSNTLACSFRASARRLLAFANHVGLQSFDLLGTSHGGAVAMMAAAVDKDDDEKRVRSLILVAPVNPWSAHGRQLAPVLSVRFVPSILAFCLPHMSFANGAIIRRLYGDPRRVSADTIEGYSKPYTTAGSFDYVFKILCTWNQDLDDLKRSLPKIADIPVLLIWGSLDRAVSPDSARLLAQNFHHCERLELPGVGHLPYEEAPEQFNAAVLAFLSKLK